MSAFVLLLSASANMTACTAAQMGGGNFARKVPFATTSFKKGGWAYFRGGELIFLERSYTCTWKFADMYY